MMKIFMAALLLVLWGSSPSFAALKVGDMAPDFSAEASKGGQRFTFSLSESLKKGPVVLYFFPPLLPPTVRSKPMILPRPPTNLPRWARPSLGCRRTP